MPTSRPSKELGTYGEIAHAVAAKLAAMRESDGYYNSYDVTEYKDPNALFVEPERSRPFIGWSPGDFETLTRESGRMRHAMSLELILGVPLGLDNFVPFASDPELLSPWGVESAMVQDVNAVIRLNQRITTASGCKTQRVLVDGWRADYAATFVDGFATVFGRIVIEFHEEKSEHPKP